MAAKAVSGGKVHSNGKRVKPARVVMIGDELTIQRGGQEYLVVVQGLNDKRRPADEASALYEEAENSIIARQQKNEERRLLWNSNKSAAPARRPGKRDRRLIRSFTRKSL